MSSFELEMSFLKRLAWSREALWYQICNSLVERSGKTALRSGFLIVASHFQPP